MTKKWVLAAALLSLAISMGCRNVTGVSKVKVAVSDGDLSVLYVTQVVQFTAAVTGTSNTAVTWSMSGTACTGNPNPCGTLSSTGLYTAPTTPPNPAQVTITATSQADSAASDSMRVTVKHITVQITPNPSNVGVNLNQQFTAVVIPDDAPQTVTWTIPNCTGGNCGNINQNNGIYSAVGATAGATLSVQAAVDPSLDPSGSSTADVTVVKSRLGGNSSNATNYAFRFSGFDTLHNATALVGSFVVSTDGIHITSGVEDVQTATGGSNEYSVTGTYSPVSNNNNLGTVSLVGAPASVPNTYTVVLDANGDIQMIESDNNGTGSGVIEQLTTDPSKFGLTSLCGPFVFGFTGVDLTGKRVGYTGVLPMDGAGHIGTACGGTTSPGLVDINDGGTASSASDVSGSYTMNNGAGSMTLTSGTFGAFHFNLYVVSGVNPPKANNPTTLYAISTDANPVISGTVVFQAPDKNNYNNQTFDGISVVSLTGADNSGANVSLTIVNTDGQGNLSGNFDQNDAGTIVSVSNFSTGYTYSATGTVGRYTFKLLGNPTANPVVPPLTFVLYASAANQGFLLDQSSTSVITGSMVLQTAPKGLGFFSASNIPGTYAAATTSSGTSGVDPIAANLLLTFVKPLQGAVSGNQYDAGHAPPGETVTGSYTLQGSGSGTVTLTAPSAESYVIYAIDITHILAMDVDKTNTNASIIYAQQ